MAIITTPPAFTVTRVISNVASMDSVPVRRTGNLPRDGGLRVRQEGNDFWLFLYGPLLPIPGDSWDARLSVTRDEVVNAAQTCYRAWQKALVDLSAPVTTEHGTTENRFPFQDAWDYAGRPACKQQAGAAMAAAGAKLFFQLFEQPAQDNPRLQRIVDCLIDAGRKQPLTLTIFSDSFFAPWPMLYVHPDAKETLAPDGHNFQWEGFWGYRHILEHNPDSIDVQTCLGPGNGGSLNLSVNVDNRLDQQFGLPCIQGQLDFFQSQNRFVRCVRTTKRDLCNALTALNFSDHILYFCCHSVCSVQGNGNANPWEAQIALSDPDEITVSDISYWMGKRDFNPQPFVFVNACQAAQFTSRFYTTLAAEFLRRKAVGFIAPLIDMPVVFAAEYGVRFFRRLLGGTAGQPQRVGPLVRDLAVEFLDKHNNPLGLVFALFRGADCYV